MQKTQGPIRDKTASGWLTGQMLVAMPSMPDPRFARSVVFVCTHAPEGAMGLIINKVLSEVDFQSLLHQINIESTPGVLDLPVHAGGPVETGRGFVLHSPDYQREGTARINKQFSVTATVEVLHDIAHGMGPANALLALGFAGWGPGQLDAEMQTNGWLVAPPDEELVFEVPPEKRWNHALSLLGVTATMLSSDMGHA